MSIYSNAEQARKNYENSLNYLITDMQSAHTAQQDSLKSQYDELLNSINRNETALRQNYEQSAREAYVNKMMTERGLAERVNQLGIDTQGTGINEYYNVGVDYGKNYAALQSALNSGLGDLDLERLNAQTQYDSNLSDLKAKQLDALTALRLDIADRGERYMNDYIDQQLAINNYYSNMRTADAQINPVINEPKPIGVGITPSQYRSDAGKAAAQSLGYSYAGMTTGGVSVFTKNGKRYYWSLDEDSNVYVLVPANEYLVGAKLYNTTSSANTTNNKTNNNKTTNTETTNNKTTNNKTTNATINVKSLIPTNSGSKIYDPAGYYTQYPRRR